MEFASLKYRKDSCTHLLLHGVTPAEAIVLSEMTPGSVTETISDIVVTGSADRTGREERARLETQFLGMEGSNKIALDIATGSSKMASDTPQTFKDAGFEDVKYEAKTEETETPPKEPEIETPVAEAPAAPAKVAAKKKAGRRRSSPE
jgi:hypothetical protein